MNSIQNNCVVSMRYTMTNAQGEILENRMQAPPVSYLHGGSTILLLLQEQLAGLQRGDKKTIYLPDDTLLPATAKFIFNVLIDDVRAASPEEIMLGYPVQASIQPCEEDCDCYQLTGSTPEN